MIDIEKFLFIYQQSEFKTLLDETENALRTLLGYINADAKLIDVHCIAYMLATTYHETAGTWKPLEEYGKGAGRQYGKPAGPYDKVYYGRGYTQNTWYDNYLMLTQAWNKEHPDHPADFTKRPELLCEPEYAYWAMSYGMRTGAYTGVGFSRFITADKCDYRGARKIINGVDCANKIAGYAVKFETIIKEVAP